MNGTPNYKRTKFACYTAYFTMSSVFCVPPLLFVTLRDTYGISYTLLGTLVLVTFVTQLAIDLVFTLFSKHFNTALTVRVMPVITALGLFVFAAVPMLFPELASVRRICLYYEGRRPALVLSEQPGRRVLDELVAIFDYMPRTKLLGNLIRPQLEKELIAYQIGRAHV